MANKDMIATGPLRYRTRMLQSGDPLVLDGPKARLYEALNLAKPADEAVTSADEHEPAPKRETAQPAKRPRKRDAKGRGKK